MKKAVILFSTVIMVALIAVCLFIQDAESVNTVKFTVSANGGVSQSISIYCDDEKYYAFLPSCADFGTMTISYNAASLYLDGKFCDSGSSFSDLTTDKEYPLEIKNRLGISVCQTKLVFMKAENIPSMFIKLTDGTIEDINKNKERSRSGYLTVINADKTIDYNGSLSRMHGRGNSTWSQPKKPYALEFSKDVDLLGMGAGKNWVLLANAFDESGLRNKIAYDTAKELGVEYAVDSEYVDLYVDNVYYGLYLLTEKVEVGENRVNINDLTESTQNVNYKPLSSYDHFEVVEDKKTKKGFNIPNDPADITGGYLLQADHHSDIVEAEKSLFQTDVLNVTVSYPKYPSRKQIDYIYSLFNQTEQELKQGDFSNIELDSFVTYYLVQELFANVDTSSAYLYKDVDSVDNKIHACSIWDFDLTIGNSWYYSNTPPDVLYQSEFNWYYYLFKNKEFRALLADKYKTFIKSNLNGILFDKLEYYKSTMNDSFRMNKERWRKYDTEDTIASQSQNRFETLDEHIEYITDYMNKRIKTLDSVWIDGKEYKYAYFLTALEDNTVKKWYSLGSGKALNDAPSAASADPS